MDRAAAGQRHRGRPQRIVGSGHEDLVAGIAQCLQAQGDELADAVAEEDLVGAEIVDPAGLVVLDDRAAGREDPPRIRISLRHRQVLDHVLDDCVGGFETEGSGVADVELEDRVSGGLHGLGLFEDGSSDVVEDIGQLRRLPEHVNRGTFPYCVCYTHAKTLAEVVMTTQRRVSRTFGICGGSLCIPLVAHATFVLVRRSVLTPALLDVCGTGRNGQRLQCTKGIRCREATEGVGR